MCTIFSKSLIIFIFVFSDITCKKMHSPRFDKNTKLSECSQCKVLTDSFNHWFEETSRGKFEGGDTAWEESNLKSYARSEIRLVEIQEGLCSELKTHQEHCYILAEEVEQVLEKWWFQEDHNTIDLHAWLCIETLKYCCPMNHFGETCSPCPLDKDNKICSGHGKCDGDGTRKGNGTCICKKGHSGQYCEECAQNFYSTNDGLCLQCDQACSGCSGDGPTACNDCKSGWQLESGVCIDVDECAIPSACNSNQYCINKKGSFTCKLCDISCKTCAGDGVSNCTSCEAPNILWSGMCITKDQQDEIVYNTIKKFGLYLGLLVISLIIYRTSKRLAAIVILTNSIIIYYHDSLSDIHAFDVLNNIWKTLRS